MNIEKQYITKDIKPPNPKEILKQQFAHCFDKNGEFDFEKFRQELSQNSDTNFSQESYGITWLGKSYARLLATDEATTLLSEDEKFNQKEQNKNSENLLIKGDNIEVLKHLSNAYYDKVKMIYIDPPYNTGSDGFVYSDDRKFTAHELSRLAGIDDDKAKRILSFTQSSSNSHSAWLTFIYPRLYIAKQLLRDDGVIFISIDDNEVAQLRLLMDEIFGEENFVSNIVWESNKNIMKGSNHIRKDHEYILCYRKNESLQNFKMENKFLKFSNPDQDPKGQWLNTNATYSNGGHEYPIKLPSGKQIIRKWRFTEQEYIQGKVALYFFNGNVPRMKIYKDDYDLFNKTPSSLITEFSTTTGNNDLEKKLNKKDVFQNPKDSNLIKYLLSFTTTKDDIILDFFAGSGTTADAVMQQNIEDAGARKFILVQLPEPIDPKKSKTAYDFVKDELKVEHPTIFDITKERIIRSAEKIKTDNTHSKDPKDLSGHDLGFKIFETISNDTGVWSDYIMSAEEFDKQSVMFDESKLRPNDIKTLLTTWKTYDNIPLTQELRTFDFDGYTGYSSDRRLYLMDKGFTTKHLKKLLELIDSDPKFNPSTIVAFAYNFTSISMRQIAENSRNFANKKGIDINFVMRY